VEHRVWGVKHVVLISSYRIFRNETGRQIITIAVLTDSLPIAKLLQNNKS